jgi:diphthine-ammonia ligase
MTEQRYKSAKRAESPEVLLRQASLLNLPLMSACASWTTYEEEFKCALRVLARDRFSHVIFGDIFLDAHKVWVERVCNECGLEAIEPLWGEHTSKLFRQFLATGAKAQIVATKAALLNDTWLGERLCEDMLSKFESLSVDACGERGEYHTLVFASPRMTSELELRKIERLMHDGYWMLDLELA